MNVVTLYPLIELFMNASSIVDNVFFLNDIDNWIVERMVYNIYCGHEYNFLILKLSREISFNSLFD